MKIYVGHSKELDYINELYNPIEKDEKLRKYTFLFPHKILRDSNNGREFYNSQNIDLFIAEVTYPATGLGIELGFAYDENIPVYCLHRENCKPCSSIKSVTENVIEYSSVNDMLNKIENIICEVEKNIGKRK